MAASFSSSSAINNNSSNNSHLQMGATFHPGTADDFHMPEVVSPAPQRVMPEVPENMQENIAHLEREASGPNRVASQPSTPRYDQTQFPSRNSSMPAHGGYPPEYGRGGYADQPDFSPFPVLRDPPPNVPPSDEQREANLENARLQVLNSNDPEMQLAWAQDALAYVEVAMQNEVRMAVVQPPRPRTPQIEHQLRVDAMNIVSFLADQGHPRALFIQGMWLEFGKFGYRVDKKEAFRCYARSAEKGYARAEYRMGMQFESSNEPHKAIKHYENGVALGDSASYYRLGMMILLGQHGQRQDYAVGLNHIRYAAQTCDENAPQGAYVYGMLLARELPQVAVPDDFLPYDLNEARINIEKAAYLGFAKAQVKMGAAYELCQLGCDFNPALSLHYNHLAARQGEPDAEMALSKWFLCGHEGVFEKNEELAFIYARRAAQNGLATAEFALGYFYEIGIHVPVDIKEARAWYAKAAANGNKDASGRIDSISRSKTLSRKDHEKVAISRIKSQYGRNSQRYSEIRQDTAPPQQATLEMPDPSTMTISGGVGGDQTGRRPVTGAPYPDGPSPGYGRMGPDQSMRSSSAFAVNPNLRTPSSGPPTPGGRAVSAGGYPHGPQGYGPPPPQGGHPYGNGQQPMVDIGFSAPHDPNADRRRRPPRPDGQYAGRGGPDPRGGRMPPGPHHPGAGPSPRPPRSDSRPQQQQHPPGPGGSPGRPGQPQQQQKPTTPANPAPSKGPKTFEEMGVPIHKSESDCVVM
ncbi:hypothetical protein VTO42DRAFT_4312 [Malbranchea cinnamomea]